MAPANVDLPVLSRRQIEGLIAEGRTIIIVDQNVLKVDPFLKYHPGGQKAVQHMIGRDATDEVTVLHSSEAKQMMLKYRIGRIEGRWRNFVPPIQGGKFRPYIECQSDTEKEETSETQQSSPVTSRPPSPVFDAEESTVRHRNLGSASSPSSSASTISSVADESDGLSHLDVITKQQIDLDISKYPPLDPDTQEAIVSKYRLLNQRLHVEHLYDCNYMAYGIESIRYSFLFCMFLLFLKLGWYTLSGLFLGCLWHQLVFTVHDAGHMGITHNFQIDSIIGMVIADYIGGLSVGWWKHNHNVHHIVTNSPEHDPDIEHLPFFAISHRFLESLRSTYYERIMPYDRLAQILLPYQAYLYYPILTFGRFNLYFLSWEFLLSGRSPKKGRAWWHRWFEIAGQVFFWYWFGYGILYKTIPTWGSRFSFLMVSHMITMPLHVQITLSHFAMSTSELGPHESFPQKMLRTTMDVDCPQWLDFFHGGLQFQAIHHLYPRIPRHNLRRAQKLVQEFCYEVGIPYALYGFVHGNQEVIGRLGEVGRQATILAKCQKVVSERGDLLHGH
ncbi:fatty acid desaturase-domain-containing protein [Xylogone sp. PMI_703]|nr:fatty acid desaturase-domain-containing protein [Xylogone sp. PMI_703]